MKHALIVQLMSVAVYAAADPGFQGAVGAWLGTVCKPVLALVDKSNKPKALVSALLAAYAVLGTALNAYAEGRLVQLDLGTAAHAVVVWAAAMFAAHAKQFFGDRNDDRKQSVAVADSAT